MSQQLRCLPSAILQMTAEHSPNAECSDRMADCLNGVFAADKDKVIKGVRTHHPAPGMAKYLDDVFARFSILVSEGIHLYYEK